MESKPEELKCRFLFYIPIVKYEVNEEEKKFEKIVDPVDSNP